MQMKFGILGMVAAVLLMLPYARAVAQEIKAFKLTDYSGYMESENQFRMNDNQSTGVETSIQDWSRQTELGISTHGYVYHPNLFDFAMGGGLIFDRNDAIRQQTFLTPDNSQESSSALMGLLWDMNLYMQFLKQKVFPVTLYYSRSNPLMQTGMEGSFTQLNENYGMNMQLHNLLPANLSLEATRNVSAGETLDRIIDNINDRISFKADRVFKENNRVAFIYELNRMDSRNGDPRRDLQEIVRLFHRTNLSSNWRFGGGKQFLFTENASYSWSNNPNVMNLNLAPNFIWQHTPKLDSNYRYGFTRIERPDTRLQSTTQSAGASIRYRPTARLNGFIAFDGDQASEAEGFLEDSYGSNIHVNYSHPVFSGGDLDLSGGLSYQRKNRETSVAQITILEESHPLNGTAPITLNRDFVVAGSVVVRNETGSQAYIEDVDYRVIEIGAQTQIERLIGGSILDGETIIVDYAIDTGGTFGYALFNQDFGADLALARYYRIYLRYSGSEQSVTSGIPTNPLNSVRSIEFGTRADLPLRWRGINIGGSARYAVQDEDINPFNRAGLDAYAQIPLPYRLNLRINARYNLVNYLHSDEDQNQLGINGNLDWSARRNLTLTAEGYYDLDDGGSLVRNRTEAILRANWRYRRLNLSAEAKYSQEAQGSLENNNLSLWLTVRRELF